MSEENPLLIGILIAFTAGVFEEGFRFLFKLLLLRPDQCIISQPVLFGLGHGIAEAMIILVPAFRERALAIVLHVTLTIVVWTGFQRQRRILYLLAAIAIHGIVNSLIPILMPLADSVLLIEGALAAIDVLMIVYAIHSIKYYVSRRIQNEEVEV